MPAIICINKVMWTLPSEASASQGPLTGLAIERGTTHELNSAIKLSVVRRQQAARPYTSKFKTCSTSVFVCTARQEKSRGEKMIALSCLPTIKVRGNVYGRQMLKLACIFPFFQTQELLSYGWPRVNPPSAFPWQQRAEKNRGSQTEESYAPTHGRTELTAGCVKENCTSTFLFSLSPYRTSRPNETHNDTLVLKAPALSALMKGPKHEISDWERKRNKCRSCLEWNSSLQHTAVYTLNITV